VRVAQEVFGDSGALTLLKGARSEGWLVLNLSHEDTLLRPVVAR